MKRFSLCIVIPFSLIFFVGCKMAEKPIPQKPNIIFIMLDDFGYSEIAYNSENISENDYDPLFLDLTLKHGHYSPDEALGFSREATPTLSRMAKEGAMFTNAFSPSNLCSPSRLGIATGVLPNRWGIYRNIDSEAHGPKPGSLLIEKLTAQGYATAHIGKWHLGSRDQRMVTEFFKKHGIKDSIDASWWKNHPRPISLFAHEIKDVYKEERFEVAFEGHRWFDLLRTGRAISVMNSKLGGDDPVGPSAPIEAHQLLYPIPINVQEYNS